MTQSIPATLIPGDGIGPEIVESVLAALDALGAPFQWERQAAGLEGVKIARRSPTRPNHREHPAHAARPEGPARNPVRAAVIGRPMCACARNSSSTPICGLRER